MAADSECMFIHDQVHQSMISFCHMTCDLEDSAVEAAFFTPFQLENSATVCSRRKVYCANSDSLNLFEGAYLKFLESLQPKI